MNHTHRPPAAPTLVLALAALAVLGGCARNEPPAPPAEPAAATAAAAGKAKHDGAPRILAEAPSGVHIQYRLYGGGDALVVLVHGWSCDSNYWQAQLPALREHYAVATVDLAGHGGSGANRASWSMADFGDDVVRVVNALPDYQKVVLVGHSMGGPVAVEAARRLKGRVAGIIGVDTSIPLTDRFSCVSGFTYVIPEEDTAGIGAHDRAGVEDPGAADHGVGEHPAEAFTAALGGDGEVKEEGLVAADL
jgi:pimeloyl-ACP methyl ester carboxylesterase